MWLCPRRRRVLLHRRSCGEILDLDNRGAYLVDHLGSFPNVDDLDLNLDSGARDECVCSLDQHVVCLVASSVSVSRNCSLVVQALLLDADLACRAVDLEERCVAFRRRRPTRSAPSASSSVIQVHQRVDEPVWAAVWACVCGNHRGSNKSTYLWRFPTLSFPGRSERSSIAGRRPGQGRRAVVLGARQHRR